MFQECDDNNSRNTADTTTQHINFSGSGQRIARLAGPGVYEVSPGLLGHYAVWWKMGTASCSASYINRTGKWCGEVVEEKSGKSGGVAECVFLSVRFFDRCSSNNGRHSYGGGRQTCQSRRSQYTSIWESCQSPERCCDGTVVTGERERLGRRVGETRGREKWLGMLDGDELPLPVAGIVIVWLQGTLLN